MLSEPCAVPVRPPPWDRLPAAFALRRKIIVRRLCPTLPCLRSPFLRTYIHKGGERRGEEHPSGLRDHGFGVRSVRRLWGTQKKGGGRYADDAFLGART